MADILQKIAAYKRDEIAAGKRDRPLSVLLQDAKAARTIHQGVKAGKSRILVGPDAYLFDALARGMPTRYYDVLARLEMLAARRT